MTEREVLTLLRRLFELGYWTAHDGSEAESIFFLIREELDDRLEELDDLDEIC